MSSHHIQLFCCFLYAPNDSGLVIPYFLPRASEGRFNSCFPNRLWDFGEVFSPVIKMPQKQSETVKTDARLASLILEVTDHTLVPDSRLGLAVQKECIWGSFPNPTQRIYRAIPTFCVQSCFDGIKALPRITMIIFIEGYNK